MNSDEKTLNEALLRAVARRLGSLTLIESVSVFSHEKPESLVASFDTIYYPDEIQTVTLEMQVYQNDDYHITYREKRTGDSWMCRWDRHENPHNTRDHFHRPPRAQSKDAVDRDFPADFFEMMEQILEKVDNRVGSVWEDID
jgi:hypothetical protein